MALFRIIDKTTGGADQDINAAFEHFKLFVIAVTAVS